MGQRLVLPPIEERSLLITMAFGLEVSHLRKLWQKFVEMDTDCNGFWTLTECYKLIQEPRTTMLAPVLDSLFHMADRNNNGSLVFEDFLVAFCCYCALSKEEVLQFMFIVLDEDRSGSISKPELMAFFSYVGPSASDSTPIFPVNNKNALDLFHNGNWRQLFFDEFASLSDSFPYITNPAFQLQQMFRERLLGTKFWAQWDKARMKVFYQEAESKVVEMMVQTPTGYWLKVHRPGRFTMREILEYSRRKAMTHKGKKVLRPGSEKDMQEGGVGAERDEQLSRTPLINIIRNPHASYHIPYIKKEKTTDKKEEDDQDIDPGSAEDTGKGIGDLDELGLSDDEEDVTQIGLPKKTLSSQWTKAPPIKKGMSNVTNPDDR